MNIEKSWYNQGRTRKLTDYIVLYIRTSSETHPEYNILSFDEQLKAAEKYADIHNYEIKHISVDKGISGKSVDNREGLKEALFFIDDNDIFMFYSLSHLSTDTKQCLDMINKIELRGAIIVSLTQKIDTVTPIGKLRLSIMASIAEYKTTQPLENIEDSIVPLLSNQLNTNLPTVQLTLELVKNIELTSITKN